MRSFKSRFIEMFGDPVVNPLKWTAKSLKYVAPAKQYPVEPKVEGNWLLNLDAIQSQSGEVIQKVRVSKDQVTGSIISFSSDNVLYSKLRPYLNKVVLPDESGFGTSELIPLLPDSEYLNRVYLANLLRSDSFVTMISNAVAGAKMPRVSMDTFWKFKIPLPPIELQNQFADFVKQVDKSKFILEVMLNYTRCRLNNMLDPYNSVSF